MKRPLSKLVRAILLVSFFGVALWSCEKQTKKEDLPDTEIKARDVVQSGNISDHRETDWELVWSDEFKQHALDTMFWTRQVLKAGHFNGEWQRYTSSTDNAYIKEGCLVIKAIHEGDTHGMNQYSSARLHTGNKMSFKYGRIAARIKLPKGQGIWPAFWMLGSNIDEIGGDTPWPESGEIDILELYGSRDNAVVEANLHYTDRSNSHTMMGSKPFKLSDGIFADDFHIFELQWNANTITWYVDGEAYASADITSGELSEFHKDFYILLNIAVGGYHAGRPDNTTPFPQHMYVDWVRVYKKKNTE